MQPENHPIPGQIAIHLELPPAFRVVPTNPTRSLNLPFIGAESVRL
jgi:hypothetical protein